MVALCPSPLFLDEYVAHFVYSLEVQIEIDSQATRLELSHARRSLDGVANV